MTPIYVHRYRLTLRNGAANAQSSRLEVHGFLIRCGDGFGCVNPWPDLGDPTADELLAAIEDGKSHRLLLRALGCVAEDGAARREGRSLFTELTIPASHATVTGDADFRALTAAGFDTVKLKTHGSDPALRERVAAAVLAGLKVRIDCNATGIAMLPSLRRLSQSIDFIEDPEPYEPNRWRKIKAELGFRLALDRMPDGVMENGGYDVRILKPALDDCAQRGEDVVFTSYMDHPLGQMFAALEAARYSGRQLEAGLLTHTLFEPDAFTKAVRSNGAQLLPPLGTGLGFDALLEALPWQRLGGPAAPVAVDCGSLLPLSGPQPATERAEEPDARGVFETVAAGCDGEQRQQAAVVRGGCAADFSSPGFWQRGESLFLSNPRAPVDDPPRKLPEGCLVFATSGSTGNPSLVCLTRVAMLANAAAVNNWLGAMGGDIWLRVLPAFHVGGMSIHARASLTRSRVLCDDGKWNARRFADMATSGGVTLTSLVPAQVHDLVLGGLRAPGSLRAVIVGGGKLEDSLYTQARSLGWPLLQSYGLTEAASQVATARPGDHRSLPPLEILPCWDARIEAAGRLQLRGAPLLSGRLTRTNTGWRLESAVDPDGWYTTADRASLQGRILTIHGRCDRLVKILGELVDLDAIEAALAAAGMPPDRGVIIAIPDERAGFCPWLVTDVGESDAGAVLKATNAALPPFARVGGLTVVAELPRSPLGKILRGELESCRLPESKH